MPALDPIDDTNLYPDKTEGGDPGEPTDVVSAADLNALKTVISENRTQANLALAATAGAVADETASFSLASTDHGKVIRVDSSGGAVVVTIPHTLFGSIIASGVFRTTILVTNADEAITIAGSGGITPQYFGRKTIRIGDLITITVTSASLALVDVREWSDPLAPYVQGTHTATTRTLALSDSAQIVPISGASNTVAVTIPHTLYDAVLGRAFQTTLVALNVTNAITLAGSGGLTLTYYGSSTITAGDLIRISVESATVCRVEVIKTGAGGGSGDVVGPASATDDRIATFDGTTGKLIQDGGVTVAELAKTSTVTVYDTASSGNYTIPTGAKAVYRRVIGAGGGGGGGASQTGATARAGGCGGGGGAVAEGWISGAELVGGTIAYVVGAGGTAGAGRTGGSAGDGADGGAGGDSSVGATVVYGGGGGRRGRSTAQAGAGGGGGGTGSVGTLGGTTAAAGGTPGASTATAIGGQGAQSPINANGGSAERGGAGGGGHSATPVNYIGGSSIFGSGGGGCGAGADATPTLVAATAGGASGSYTAGGGGAAGTSGAAPTAGTAGTAANSGRGGSGGGGGGGSVTAGVAGAAGGAGGAGGGGGGGGGCGEGAGAGGAGGVGGAGRVEFYAFF